MACVLTQDISLDCRDSVGGIKRVLITELSNKATLTEVAGVVTAFTLSTGKQFWIYALPQETGFATQTPTGSVENGTVFWQQQVDLVINKLKTSVRNELKLLIQNVVMVIVEDNNGTYWLFGKTNGMNYLSGTDQTGTAMGDRSGYAITLTGKEKEPMIEVTSGLIASLIIPAP